MSLTKKYHTFFKSDFFYLLDYNNDNFIVLFNADMGKEEEFLLPNGDWYVLVNKDIAGIKSLGKVNSKIIVEPSTGVVLKKGS